MKNLIFLSTFMLIYNLGLCQDGFTFFQLKGGYVHREGMSLNIGFDFSKKYYSAYELTGTYMQSFAKEVSYETVFNEADSSYTQRELKHSYKNLLVGFQYKPIMFREKNTAMKFRFGGFMGTDFDKFIISPNVGLELVHSLGKGFDLTLSNNNGYYFWASKPTRWRNSIELGFRLGL